jgi:3,4-dihydroxy 2-butanone 4-phosphate synthase/GTP cyclohydrolase II
VLRDLGIESVRLMTNNPDKTASLEDFGIHVSERVPLAISPTEHNRAYLRTKAERMGHHLPTVDLPPVATDHQAEHPEHADHPEQGETA